MKDETVAALGRFHGDMPHASRGEISLLSRHDNEPDHRGVGPDRVGRCHADVAGDVPCMRSTRRREAPSAPSNTITTVRGCTACTAPVTSRRMRATSALLERKPSIPLIRYAASTIRRSSTVGISEASGTRSRTAASSPIRTGERMSDIAPTDRGHAAQACVPIYVHR